MSKKTQVRIYNSSDVDGLAEQINELLTCFHFERIVDIKYSCSTCYSEGMSEELETYTAMIIYEVACDA
jgi:hypothetical protein